MDGQTVVGRDGTSFMTATAGERIAVIGAGLMGAGIAQVFAAAGHEVALQDVSEEALARAPQAIRANLAFLAVNGLYARDGVEAAGARVATPPASRPPPTCVVRPRGRASSSSVSSKTCF
jgi:pyruvate/2-oxoglutarate dehydrogenase complex dihydrolipoamide dehydrogenase (E3) component